MKKLSALLLTLVFALSLTACRKSNTSSDNSSVSSVLKQDDPSETEISTEQSSESVTESETDSKTENNSSNTLSDKKNESSKTTTSAQNTSSQPEQTPPTQNPSSQPDAASQAQISSSKPEPTQPAKLNPKTDFKFGEYVAKYFDNDSQCYYETSLKFYKDFEGVEYHRERFYTKEYCKKSYQDSGMEFSEENFSYEYSITLNGITYYNLGDYDHLSESYEITDTVIKISPDNNNWSELSLNADGTLVLESTIRNNRYAKVGTVFTLAE